MQEQPRIHQSIATSALIVSQWDRENTREVYSPMSDYTTIPAT
jgi:hypothetical protein